MAILVGTSTLRAERYANLLDDTGRYTFAQAQDRMKRYLVAALKVIKTIQVGELPWGITIAAP